MMGLGPKEKYLYIIDFGLAKRYIDKKTGQHIVPASGRSMTGTARYASINAHLGQEQSRRDDLEAIGYMLVYFVKGSLPWQGLGGKNKTEKYNAIKDKKMQLSVEALCSGIPSEFAEFLKYCKNLRFEETPNYDYLRGLFKNIMTQNGFVNDNMFMWFLTKDQLK